MKPELKQFGTLTQADFNRFPIWVGVHTCDYGEPWYDETDEETFRPWLGELPINPKIGMFLVRSQIVLADGTRFVGFITPIIGTGEVADSELRNVQPHLFDSQGNLISFWGGLFGVSEDGKKSTYDALDRASKQVFPFRFTADPGLTVGSQSGEVRGFGRILDFKTGQTEFTT
jgi:hypothetical protein